MTIVSDTEILTHSHVKSEKKTNEQNSRRRTRSIGRSKKTPAVNYLEAKAASYRQELDTAEISLFLAFGQWSAARRKKGREPVRSHPYPTPSLLLLLLFFFCSHLFALSPRSKLLEQAKQR